MKTIIILSVAAIILYIVWNVLCRINDKILTKKNNQEILGLLDSLEIIDIDEIKEILKIEATEHFDIIKKSTTPMTVYINVKVDDFIENIPTLAGDRNVDVTHNEFNPKILNSAFFCNTPRYKFQKFEKNHKNNKSFYKCETHIYNDNRGLDHQGFNVHVNNIYEELIFKIDQDEFIIYNSSFGSESKGKNLRTMEYSLTNS